jgi:hypothetical protein
VLCLGQIGLTIRIAAILLEQTTAALGPSVPNRKPGPFVRRGGGEIDHMMMMGYEGMVVVRFVF